MEQQTAFDFDDRAAQRREAVKSALGATSIRFDGPEIDQEARTRLTGQTLRVFELMRDRRWRTLREISQAVGASEASCSARLRDLRKKHFGQHTVNRRNLGKGLFEYQVCPALTQHIS